MIILNFIPNVSAGMFTGSAVILGYLLIDELTANEQNALGNWLMLTAQVLCTNAFYKQVMDERKQAKFNNTSKVSEVEILKKMVNALNKQINDLEDKI